MSASGTVRSIEDVCSLDELSLERRLDFIRREVAPHAVARAAGEHGTAWEFEDSPGMRETLERLIELERDCCASWSFELTETEKNGRLRLSVEGDGAGSILLRALSRSDA